jgi:TolB-like protein/tetratricopeptide (TPR) repeat protein
MKNLTGEAEQQYFVDGVTDELIGQLGQVSGLKRVISRTSVMQYKKTDKSLSDIARELNVDAVVEGTVYQAGDKVRIRFQLIDALPEERNLWGQTYERSKSDIRMMYSEVARTVIEKINLELTQEEEKRFAGTGKVNPKAYDAWLKGLHLMDTGAKDDLLAAGECFEKAVKIAPDWAPPYLGLSQVWARRMQMTWVQATEAMPKIYQYLNKAQQLDPNVEGLASRLAGTAVWTEWDWEKGEREYKKALELNPNDAKSRALYGHFLIIMRRPDEGLKQVKRAVELDPMTPLTLGLASRAYSFTGNYKTALVLAKKALSINPGHFFATGALDNAYYHLGDLDNWFEAWKKVAWWDDQTLAVIDEIYYQQGFHAAIEKIIEVNEEEARKAHISHTGQAGRYLMINNIEKAIENLERAYVVHDPNLPYMDVLHAQYSKNLDVLRRHPRYIALLKKMNLPIKRKK